MSLLKVVSIFDSKVDAWYPPVFAPSLGHILRQFEELANNPQSEFSKYGTDFHMYMIGEWDDQLNEFKLHPPESLGTFESLKKVTKDSLPVSMPKAVAREFKLERERDKKRKRRK